MVKIASVFSGQGSQYPGMGKDLCDNFKIARDIYECAGDIFGFDVAKVSFEGSEIELSDAAVTQPVIFTLSAAAFSVSKGEIPEFSATAGHSLGEYAALWSAGVYSLEDGMRLIKLRAGAMAKAAKANPGVMYAVLGADGQAVEAACAQAGGMAMAVNYNMPSQTVISGEEAACAKAAEILIGQGHKAIKLPVGGAFHTPMMQSGADELFEGAKAINYSKPNLDFYSNLTGKLVKEELDYPDYFAKHMVNPVRFVDQVRAMSDDSITTFIEFGPKKTLSGLIKKNNKAAAAVCVEDAQSLKKVIEQINAK